jgi:DNA-binding CsgD family transcriptional regulator
MAGAGRVVDWDLPAFFVVPALARAGVVTAALDRLADLRLVLDRLTGFRGEHATALAVAYDGPVELTLGIGRAKLGDVEGAIEELRTAVTCAEAAGSPGFAAEARFHLAALLATSDPVEATSLAEVARRTAQAIGMAAYRQPITDLLARLERTRANEILSAREDEVARLVAEGLTNREIAQRLVISERTAQNHVQHILTKLGFSSRAQIAGWVAAQRR